MHLKYINVKFALFFESNSNEINGLLLQQKTDSKNTKRIAQFLETRVDFKEKRNHTTNNKLGYYKKVTSKIKKNENARATLMRK